METGEKAGASFALQGRGRGGTDQFAFKRCAAKLTAPVMSLKRVLLELVKGKDGRLTKIVTSIRTQFVVEQCM